MIVTCIPLFLLAGFLSPCATVPITGRQRLSIIPSLQMLSMSYQLYGEVLKSAQLSMNGQKAPGCAPKADCFPGWHTLAMLEKINLDVCQSKQ
jgi:hypothetical protein